jgi:hypothetical protein
LSFLRRVLGVVPLGDERSPGSTGCLFPAAIPWRPTDQPIPRLIDAILDALGLPPMPSPAPGRPGTFSLADASHVCAALQRAGVTEIRIQPYTLAFDHRSSDEWSPDWASMSSPTPGSYAGFPSTVVSACEGEGRGQ